MIRANARRTISEYRSCEWKNTAGDVWLRFKWKWIARVPKSTNRWFIFACRIDFDRQRDRAHLPTEIAHSDVFAHLFSVNSTCTEMFRLLMFFLFFSYSTHFVLVTFAFFLSSASKYFNYNFQIILYVPTHRRVCFVLLILRCGNNSCFCVGINVCFWKQWNEDTKEQRFEGATCMAGDCAANE